MVPVLGKKMDHVDPIFSDIDRIKWTKIRPFRTTRFDNATLRVMLINIDWVSLEPVMGNLSFAPNAG